MTTPNTRTIALTLLLAASPLSGCGCSPTITRQYHPYFEAGGPPCNDGYASGFECEPGSQCVERHTADREGQCIEIDSGEYHPYPEAGGPPCNDGYAWIYQCQEGDTCFEEHTADTFGLCGPPE